jgi:hypothetical protein
MIAGRIYGFDTIGSMTSSIQNHEKLVETGLQLFKH